jgi:hypothetical protein
MAVAYWMVQRRPHRGGPPGRTALQTADALPAPQRALTCVRERVGADVTRCIPENSTWLVDWSLVKGNMMPPRDPDDDDEEDEDDEPDDEPAVIREPDE